MRDPDEQTDFVDAPWRAWLSRHTPKTMPDHDASRAHATS